MPSNDKLLRWIDLIAALLRRRFPVSFDELSRDVPAYAHDGPPSETLQRMFERDKDELRSAGIAIETVSGAEGDPSLYRLKPDAFYLPYLVLSGADGMPRTPSAGAGYRALRTLILPPEEAAMLRRAADRVIALGAPPLTADATRALRKLRYDLPDALSVPIDTSKTETDGTQFSTLMEAIERSKQVTFEYHSIGRDSKDARSVEPYGLVFLTGNWYLVAREPRVDGIRLFRTTRMAKTRVNPKAPGTPDFTVPATFDLKAHARSRQAWELGTGDIEGIDVHFRTLGGDVTSALRLGEPLPWPGADGTRSRFYVRRRDAFLRWLLTFAGDAVPVAPEPVVDAWRTLVRETLAVHAKGVTANRRGADERAAEGRA
jgi:proteasome accessory factor B